MQERLKRQLDDEKKMLSTLGDAERIGIISHACSRFGFLSV
ncbi:hypothetical protein SAMN05216386_1761 [Nitrosospira briensis]|uniref:Uncharacterized protein n=1 Tax=Nitrosospira briensis TaxID=35799 RepID=A0A1I5BPM5_9PROT|nr:hypothetical protein SAMN05216386_1761 [Nitrosospira briensis]